MEVLTVPEESELLKSQEALNEISMDRKHSIQSEDSDMLGSTQKTVQDHPRRPNITIRQETTSTESPLEISDDQTLVGDGSAEDIVDMNFEGKLNNNLLDCKDPGFWAYQVSKTFQNLKRTKTRPAHFTQKHSSKL